MPKIITTKFGEVTYNSSDIVTFIKPILGFSDLKKYIVISRPESEPFKWLQSVEDPNTCFVIVDPTLICKNYILEISNFDMKQLKGSDNKDEYFIYGIVTIPKGNPDDMSVNLQGPIVIYSNNLNAVQLILNNPDYNIHHKVLRSEEMV